jgi:MoaA/NifB/PqqE/SkfB family radical SAM enzyme
MDGALFRRIGEELFPTAELVDLRGWGESLLLPDIVELIRYTCDFGCDIRFMTNLSFRREKVLAALAESNCYLAVSLDSAEDDILSKLRRGASLTRIRSNLQFLVKQYRALHGDSDRIVLYCTVQRPALATLRSLVTFASEVGIQEIRLAGVLTKKPHLSLSECDANVIVALESVALASQQHGIRVVIATHFAGLPESGPEKPPCIRPWSFACVNVDGSTGFCDHLIGPLARKYHIGDLRSSSFRDIWNSDQWQGLRREHCMERRADFRLFAHCDWCYRNRYVEFEDYFHKELDSFKVYAR